MKAFNESLRYEYPLNENSVIIDGGGYEGNWMKGMWEKYHCHIHVFEPVSGFYQQCCRVATELEQGPERKIKVHQKGLWTFDTYDSFGVRGDTTGMFADSPVEEIVELVSVADVVRSLGKVDVLKLNIEGAEYEVLSWLHHYKLMDKIENIQVQFHFNFPEAKSRYPHVVNLISHTHEPEWDSEPVWQNFRKK